MATNGSQIRTASKIYSEQNHTQTCVTSDILSENSILVASGAKSLARKLATRKGILITDVNGNATFLEVPEGTAGYNKILATDSNGNLIWVNK